MVKYISDAVRVQVLYESGIKRAQTISNKTKIPLRTCQRHVSKLERGEDLERKPYKRNKSLVEPATIRKVIRKVTNPKKPKSLRKIAGESGISHEQVRTILKNSGIRYERTKRRVVINEKSREKRKAFARSMLPRMSDWGFTFFSDEMSIWLERSVPGGQWIREHREEGRMELENDGLEEYRIGRHGPKLHAWGAISVKGTTKLELFTDNLKAVGYLKILRRRKRDMDALYPEGYYFQHDGSGVHRADEVRDYINQEFYRLDWPPYSPDLSPIENIWGWLKGEVSKDVPTTIDALKKSLRKHWKRITPEFLAPYFNSMPERMRLVLDSDGRKINY